MPETQHQASILLAAESPASSKLIGKQLQDLFNLHNADDAEQAWEALLEHRGISLLICELEIAIDRFGLLERIRSATDSWLAATPVLLLVGEDDSDDRRESAFQMGATDFINLPFASAELRARVRLHANIYSQHALQPTLEMQPVSAVNVLQQLSHENFFNSRVQQELSFSQRHRSNLSLCKLKLDNIKAIVSGFDKSIAISVVQAVARIIQQTLRREDTLCYLGNAEFCILFPATNGIGATSGVNRILKNTADRKIRIAGKRVPVTLSGAVLNCIASEDDNLEQIYQQLEAGLKEAIARGGNQIVSQLATGEERVYSIDRALKLIEAGDTADLAEHAGALLQRVLPLLQFGDQALGLDACSSLNALEQKLGTASPTERDK